MTLLNILAFSGRVEQLLSRPSREQDFVKSPQGRMELTLNGPKDDCHTGETRLADSRTLPLYPRNTVIRNVRQVTVLSVEELKEVAERLSIPVIDPGWFGANILVSGIPDLTLLPPSTRLQFSSGATIVNDMENYPCSQIAEVVGRHHPKAKRMVVKAAMHKRGITAWVEREGDIKLGDSIKVICPPNRVYPHMKVSA